VAAVRDLARNIKLNGTEAIANEEVYIRKRYIRAVNDVIDEMFCRLT